jgi:hypothetical protein
MSTIHTDVFCRYVLSHSCICYQTNCSSRFLRTVYVTANRTACFELGEFETAKKMFEAGSTLRSSTGKDTTQYLRAIRKCVLEMAGMALQNVIDTV